MKRARARFRTAQARGSSPPRARSGASSLYSFCVSSKVIAVSSTPNDFMSCCNFSVLPPATRSFDSF